MASNTAAADVALKISGARVTGDQMKFVKSVHQVTERPRLKWCPLETRHPSPPDH
jgi:hypothetical protein